jgi:hypothetical protein
MPGRKKQSHPKNKSTRSHSQRRKQWFLEFKPAATEIKIVIEDQDYAIAQKLEQNSKRGKTEIRGKN